MKYLVTFHTHFDAIQYIKFLKKRSISGKLQPVPRRISSSCGTCATFDHPRAIDPEAFFAEGCEEIFRLEGNAEFLLKKEA